MLLLAGPPRLALAANCSVPSGTYPTIQAAINDSNCDTINLMGMTYTENLNIPRSLTMQGAGIVTTTIDGNNGTRVITVTGSSTMVTIKDLRITGGDASNADPVVVVTGRIGGGVLVDGGAMLYLDNVRVYSNTARASGNGTGFGGGIGVRGGSTLHVQNSKLDTNLANSSATGQTGFGGGLAVVNGSAYVTSTTISSNTAKVVNTSGGGQGGGLYVAGDALVSPDRAILYLTDSSVMANKAYDVNATGDGEGGGLFIGNSDDTRVVLNGNTWQGNYARSKTAAGGRGDGGAIAVEFTSGGATLTATRDTFAGNVANASDGDHAVDEARGGAISLDTSQTDGTITATLTYITMTNNIAKSGIGTGEGRGGGIHARHAAVTLDRSTLISNTAAISDDGNGGGLYAREPLAGNNIVVVNTVLADNTARGNGRGAQLHLDFTSASQNELSVVHSTLANNTLNSHEALFFNGPTAGDQLSITNTIIASHTAGIRNVNATGFLRGQYLLFFGNTEDQPAAGTTAFPDTTNWFNGDPDFVDPAAGDYHIETNSAAIDKGIDAGINVDHDGQTRPFTSSGQFDIGAFEWPHFILDLYLPVVIK
ncbi:MAG: choice-of-anchor Q domain-containing protein [Anaerolineae bacterium]